MGKSAAPWRWSGQLPHSHGATVSQVILAWYMQNPLITAVIPGAKQPDQVIQNAAALQLELTPSEYQTIEEAFAGFK